MPQRTLQTAGRNRPEWAAQGSLPASQPWYAAARLLRQCFPWLALCLTSVSLQAQSGVVRFGEQIVPGATVTVTQGVTKFSTNTDSSGHYVLPTLGGGTWNVEVTMFGFQGDHKSLQDPQTSQELDMTLRLAEPRAFAGGGGRQQGRDDTVDPLLSSSSDALPMPSAPAGANGNNNEAFLVAGSLTQGAPPSNNLDANRNQLFGNGNNNTGQADAAANLPASPVPGFGGAGSGEGRGRFGGGRGGGRFNGGRGRPFAGTQAGNRRSPNEIHGMIFGTLGNSIWNAEPYSISGQNVTQPSTAQARLGVVLGGPLLIPKLIHDPSTFFSLSYFATRATNPFTATSTVPTASERQGDFSQAAQTLYDPLTGSPFPGNVIPASRLNPIAQALLPYIPSANLPGLVNNFVFQSAVPQNSDNLSLRLQRNAAKNDRLAFQLNFQRRGGDTAQPFGYLDATSGSGWNTNISWTHNFSATHINTVRTAFNRSTSQTVPYFAYGSDVAALVGISGTSSNPNNYGPPNLNFTNFGSLSDGAPVLVRNQSQSASDYFVWVHGAHSLTFGVQFTRTDLNNQTDANGRGTFNFTGLATSPVQTGGAASNNTGFDFADYLLGLPQSSSIRYGDSNTYFRQNTWSGFVQDDWKARPSLTLTYGLRYEYFSPLSERYGKIANLDIAPGFTDVAVVTPGGGAGPYSGSFPSGLINPDYHNFSPRLGLAWKAPRVRKSTVVRAGYGIYYNGQAYNQFASRLAQQPPFAISNNINTSLADPLTLATAFSLTSPADITNTYAVNRNYQTPYAQSWNISVQRDLPAGFFLEVGYLGTKGTHLDVQLVPNSGLAATAANRNQLGSATGFTYDTPEGNSIYHAFQARLQRRFRSGISMNAVYTFSKSIDDSSTFGGVGNSVAQNWLDLSAERGLSSFDRRHVLTMNWVWTSPFGTATSHLALNRWQSGLLKDWQISGSLTAETGTPLTARILGSGALLAQTNGVGSERADATGLPIQTAAGFFNPAAFAAPLTGDLGDAGRNTIPGPGLVSVNLSFGRSFQVGDSRRRLEIRMEGNNVLNQASITNLNTVVNSINYGLPLSAAPMRTLSAVLRFRF